jgi:hypothetical protein
MSREIYTQYQQPTIPPPAYQANYLDLGAKISSEVSNDQKLKEFCRSYEISPLFQEDIQCIKKYDIIVLCDDSGSMVEPSRYLSFKDNQMVDKTRWDELRETVEVITELCVLLDDDGIDIWFLNGNYPIKNVTDKNKVSELFNNRKPSGRTPLTRVTRQIMSEPLQSGKPRLILIATDGEPNDNDGYSDCDNFLMLLKNRNVENNRISILACTSSDSQMDWLDIVDKEAKHVDVIDDYLSERKQILAIQGQNFSYSHGDHILKMLLGPILQKYDDLDEKPINKNKYTHQINKNKRNKKCVIL